MKCLCLRHVAFEHLGTFGAVLKDADFAIDILDVGVDPIPGNAPRDADLLVLLGGPLGVHDVTTHPYLSDEIAWAEQRLNAGKPTLGICLGAQIMASALGASVTAGAEREIGWKSVRVDERVRNNPLSLLAAAPIFHWHDDNIDLPIGAECLASTDQSPVQAFRIDEFALGLQFHIEMEPAQIERWLIGHWAALQSAKVNPADIRRDTTIFGPKATEVGPAVIRSWIQKAF